MKNIFFNLGKGSKIDKITRRFYHNFRLHHKLFFLTSIAIVLATSASLLIFANTKVISTEKNRQDKSNPIPPTEIELETSEQAGIEKPISKTPTKMLNKTTTPTPKRTTSTPSPTSGTSCSSNNQQATTTPTQPQAPNPITPTPTPTQTPLPTTQTYQDGLMTVKVTCSGPHDYYGTQLGNHIDLLISDAGIDTKPNGVWTYVINPQGQNVYLAYTGPVASNAGASVHQSIYSIRNGTQLILESGKSYTVKISKGGYTSGDPGPLLGETISQITFIPNCPF